MKGVAHIVSDCLYHREQLVPDTMPADLLGTNVFVNATGKFRFRYGPINPKMNFFHADEINRTTPKTQSALLQAMEEGSISTPKGVKQLHEVFMVLATRNPIDLEGTFPLPAAQLDRFAVELIYDRLPEELEAQVVVKTAFDRHGLDPALKGLISIADIPLIRQEIAKVHCAPGIFAYAHKLIYATRPGVLKELEGFFRAEVSVRPAQWLLRLGRARAFLKGRDFVTPEDIKFFAKAALRHRLYLSEEKLLERVSADAVIEKLIDLVPIVKD
jgi:MoxR-like ATPase